jgi:hypothetical protein
LRGVLVAIPAHPGKQLLLATSRDDLDGDELFLFRAMLAAFVVAVAWVAMVASGVDNNLTSIIDRFSPAQVIFAKGIERLRALQRGSSIRESASLSAARSSRSELQQVRSRSARWAKVGLWTKADSVTSLKDFEATPE